MHLLDFVQEFCQISRSSHDLVFLSLENIQRLVQILYRRVQDMDRFEGWCTGLRQERIEYLSLPCHPLVDVFNSSPTTQATRWACHSSRIVTESFHQLLGKG